MQGKQLVSGAHETHGRPAISKLVVHDFRNRQFGESFFERLLQTFCERCTFDDRVEHEHFGFAIRLTLEAGYDTGICTKSAELLEQRGRRIAAGIETHGYRHELLLDGLVSGLFCDIRHLNGEAAWRCEGGYSSIRCGNTLCFEAVGECGREGFTKTLECFGREFFNEEFNE